MSSPAAETETAGQGPRVRYEKHGRVARITLDRPHVLNAMDTRMHEELAEVWDDFEADDDIWVGVLSGAGERAFSVGQDLKERAAQIRSGEAEPTTFGSRGRPGWPRLTERFDMVKPLIAEVRGYALGGGFELALACDIVVASEDAEFALPEARRGLVPGAGGVFRLSRQIPFTTAMGYLMTGRRMTAARAYELGLVNEVVPPGDLRACADGWVRDVLRCSPLSVRSIKEAAAKSAGMSVEQAFATRYAWEEKRMRSRDAEEGPLAFAEQRPPEWRGY
ncbi:MULTISPECIES: enoyl-CoA-hydratase DpgD [Nocardiopsis]|uniref:enoyl-CoA-hydratase DpgD n=1 Tax=Nocardiopsis TaxID=2013 RepID=UPI0009FDADBD|nr:MULTISPECIES: enoyl-CoA-hydratase DpgD [Nocardiopsis]